MNFLDFLKDKKKKKNTKKRKPLKSKMSITSKAARKLRKTKNVKVSGNRKDKTRPSASYYYNILKKPIGTKVRYAPHEGLGGSGKMYTYTLQIRKNGSPFWKKMD